MVRVEPLFVGLAGATPVALVLLRVRRDVGHGPGERVRVARPEQYAVGSRRDQLVSEPWPAAIAGVPAAMASTTTRPNVSSQTDGTRTARTRDISSGPGRADRARASRRRGAPRPRRSPRGRASRPGDDQAQPRVMGRAEVTVPGRHQQPQALALFEPADVATTGSHGVGWMSR